MLLNISKFFSLFCPYSLLPIAAHAESLDNCCGPNECVRETGPCSLRTCVEHKGFCAQYIANMCDCESGYKRHPCTGKCVKDGKCPIGKCTTTSTPISSGPCVPKNCTA